MRRTQYSIVKNNNSPGIYPGETIYHITDYLFNARSKSARMFV